MDALSQLPEWLGVAVATAVAAVVGFFGKEAWQAVRRGHHKTAERHRAMSDLVGLLEDSGSVYESQNYMARQLLARLRQRYPAETDDAGAVGFDEIFYRLHDKMDEEESELRTLIRSATVNSLRSLNKGLRKWLKANKEFRTPAKASESRGLLAEDLRELELHLNQWFDKYEAVIPQDEKRSLVYLGDEKGHGLKFPTRIETSARAVVKELS